MTVGAPGILRWCRRESSLSVSLSLSLSHTHTHTHTYTRPTTVEVTLLALSFHGHPQRHRETDIVCLSQAPLPQYQQPCVSLPILKRGYGTEGSAPPLTGPRTQPALSPPGGGLRCLGKPQEPGASGREVELFKQPSRAAFLSQRNRWPAPPSRPMIIQ